MSRSGFSEDEWARMTLELQDLLVEASRHRGTVTYGEIARRVFGGRAVARSSAVMTLVDDACDALDEGRGTVTASLVVRSDTGMPGEGYFLWAESAGYDLADRGGFWREQAERVWESWSDDSTLASTERELEVPECGSTASD
jgi:hypothetical protein